jgi:hypothetical protein
VHFSITDAQHGAKYVFTIGDEQVAREKARGRHGLAGEFAMPDLGGITRAVTLEARTGGHGDADDDDDDETAALTQTLLYLAPAPAAGVPIAAPPAFAVAPAPAPESAPAVAPSQQSQPLLGSKAQPQHSRGRPARKRATGRDRTDTKPRSGREAKRKAERRAIYLRHALGSGGAADLLSAWESPNSDAGTPRAETTPRATITPAAKVVDAGGNGAVLAIIVPALLALAALALATVAVVRRRRDPRSSHLS